MHVPRHRGSGHACTRASVQDFVFWGILFSWELKGFCRYTRRKKSSKRKPLKNPIQFKGFFVWQNGICLEAFKRHIYDEAGTKKD